MLCSSLQGAHAHCSSSSNKHVLTSIIQSAACCVYSLAMKLCVVCHLHKPKNCRVFVFCPPHERCVKHHPGKPSRPKQLQQMAYRQHLLVASSPSPHCCDTDSQVMPHSRMVAIHGDIPAAAAPSTAHHSPASTPPGLGVAHPHQHVA